MAKAGETDLSNRSDIVVLRLLEDAAKAGKPVQPFLTELRCRLYKLRLQSMRYDVVVKVIHPQNRSTG